jgi:glucose/arabinose dehydrogenase
VFLSALDGQRIYVVSLDRNGESTGTPEDFLKGQYGRLRSVAMDPQGALWITTSNKDGVGTPAPDDDKVLRIVPPTSGGNSPL